MKTDLFLHMTAAARIAAARLREGEAWREMHRRPDALPLPNEDTPNPVPTRKISLRAVRRVI